MTAPHGYPPQAPPAQYPPQYPPAPPAYAPQPQYAPQYPPAPQYGPPPAPGYPPMQYAQPAAPLVQGSIDDFYNQPSTGGGKSLSFEAIGQTYVGVVTRAIGTGDIQQQTDKFGKPLTFRDGRAKFVMKVPLQMQPDAAHPDGLAQWYVKGSVRDELSRAMSEAGAPVGPPEPGAAIQVTFVGERSSGPGMNPTKMYAVTYHRPPGAAPVSAPQAAPAQQYAQPAPVAQAPAFVPPAQPAYAPPPVQQYAPAPMAPPVAQQPQAPAQPPQIGGYRVPPDMTAGQQAILQGLVNKQ